MSKNDIVIEFNKNDIEKYKQIFSKDALRKDGKPTKSFQNWLKLDEKHIIKKTVAVIENDSDMYRNNKIINKSYEKPLTSNEFEQKISELINQAQNLKNNDKEKQDLQNKIKDLLKINQSNLNLTMNTNIDALDMSIQDVNLDTSDNYVAFVYFFWSPETMNFKIIGLHSINPLFEFANIKQTFYLIKPAMITNDCPIYFCFDKIPYSITFDIKDDIINLTEMFINASETSDIFYYMEKNKNYIRIFGFNKIPLRIWLEFLLILGFFQMLEFLILQNIFFGVK